MGRRIRISSTSNEVLAELNDTRTAQAIWDSLPITGRVSLWGQEIYFSIPISLEPDSGHELVSLGDLGYWPEGKAFCIFFGPTPISGKGEIRPASPVNVFGKVTGDARVLGRVKAGAEIKVTRGE
jgi:hypothetical protein